MMFMSKAELEEVIMGLQRKVNAITYCLDRDVKSLFSAQTRVKNLEHSILEHKEALAEIEAEMLEAHNQLQAMEGKRE